MNTKRYEYSALYIRKRTGKCIGKSASHYDTLEEARRDHHWPLHGEEIRFVRREVGEWEDAE